MKRVGRKACYPPREKKRLKATGPHEHPLLLVAKAPESCTNLFLGSLLGGLGDLAGTSLVRLGDGLDDTDLGNS